MNRKVVIVGFSLVLLTGVITFNVVAYNQAHAMLHFAASGERSLSPEKLSFLGKVRTLIFGVNLPRPYGNKIPNNEELTCEARTIPQSKEITLGSWLCLNQGEDSLAILFHGYGADKSSLLKEAAAFHKLGWSVLLVDFRGSGDSSENYTTVGVVEAEDVSAAVRFAKKNVSFTRLLLYGKSMGGVAILRAIATSALRADVVIIEAVFDTMLNTVRNRFRSMRLPSFPAAELLLFWSGKQFNINAFAHNPVEYAKKVDAPILFLHGSNDPRTRVEDGHRVFDETASTFKRFREFPGIGHEDYLASFPHEWQDEVRKFLKAVENN